MKAVRAAFNYEIDIQAEDGSIQGSVLGPFHSGQYHAEIAASMIEGELAQLQHCPSAHPSCTLAAVCELSGAHMASTCANRLADGGMRAQAFGLAVFGFELHLRAAACMMLCSQEHHASLASAESVPEQRTCTAMVGSDAAWNCSAMLVLDFALKPCC